MVGVSVEDDSKPSEIKLELSAFLENTKGTM